MVFGHLDLRSPPPPPSLSFCETYFALCRRSMDGRLVSKVFKRGKHPPPMSPSDKKVKFARFLSRHSSRTSSENRAKFPLTFGHNFSVTISHTDDAKPVRLRSSFVNRRKRESESPRRLSCQPAVLDNFPRGWVTNVAN